mgnify:CR=1 FL=1
MAERSFSKEVKHLKIEEGETFRGEGILKITKAILENGVGYVAVIRDPLSACFFFEMFNQYMELTCIVNI